MLFSCYPTLLGFDRTRHYVVTAGRAWMCLDRAGSRHYHARQLCCPPPTTETKHMRNPLRVRFVRDVAMTGGTQVLQGLFAMLGGILVARTLGPSGKGTISVLVALGSMAVLLASFGVQMSSIYFLGRFKSNRDAIISNNYVFGLVGGVAAAIGLALVCVAFEQALLNGIGLGLLFLYVCFVPFNYFNEFARRTVLGEGRVAAFNIPQLVTGSGLLFGAGAAILIFGRHVGPVLAMRVGIEALVSLGLVVYIHRVVRFRFKPSIQLLREQVKYGVKNYASSLLWVVLLQSDLVLCNHFLGSKPTGIYSVAVSFGVPVTLLASVVGTLTFQRVSSNNIRPSRIANTNRATRVLVVISAVSTIAMAVAASWIVPLIYGARFGAASQALLLLLPGLFALNLETVLMNSLAGEGSPPIVYRAPIVGVVVNLGANLFVIPRWGIDGAAVTSTVGYCIVLALVLGYYLRSTGSRARDVLVVKNHDLRALLGYGTPSAPTLTADAT
jgi:O-antigen/teichoic acid export membrane protein